MNAAGAAKLEADLRRRFRVADREVVIASRSFRLLMPANAEELISEDDFVRDERLPYWADLWPSAIALAEDVMARGTRAKVLELGCGVGLVSIAAALTGADVLATDYYEDALRFARLNAWRNGGHTIATRMLDWRFIPRDLGPFDTILASDVLYERPYGERVAEVLSRTLAVDGEAWIADPGRVGREPFLDAARRSRLAARVDRTIPYERDGVRQSIALLHVHKVM